MEEESPKIPPRCAIAKAMGYMLIRPFAVGRRNFLFAGSHQGAQRAAIFYSLFACCKLNDVDPVEWLTDVMARLPQHPVNRIEELLPHLWKKNNTEIVG